MEKVSVDNRLLKFFNMSEDEYDVHIEKILTEEHQRSQRQLKNVYNMKMSFPLTLVELLKTHNCIDEDELINQPEKYSFTSQQFHDFFENVTGYLHDHYGYLEDEECGYENKAYYLEMHSNLIEFFVMYGQGVCTIMKMVNEEEKEMIPQQIIGSLVGWQEFVEQQMKNLTDEESK